jgi:DNA-binding MarR family transcriptional regulator
MARSCSVRGVFRPLNSPGAEAGKHRRRNGHRPRRSGRGASRRWRSISPVGGDGQNAPDYQRLLEFRTGLRRFLRWSEEQAAAAGLTPAQHQLLLAVRGHPRPEGPTIGEVADYLLLRHHSAVELVDRTEAAGLVRRIRDGPDHRIVRLQLTDRGASRLEQLAGLHAEELARFAGRFRSLWAGLNEVPDPV